MKMLVLLTALLAGAFLLGRPLIAENWWDDPDPPPSYVDFESTNWVEFKARYYPNCSLTPDQIALVYMFDFQHMAPSTIRRIEESGGWDAFHEKAKNPPWENQPYDPPEIPSQPDWSPNQQSGGQQRDIRQLRDAMFDAQRNMERAMENDASIDEVLELHKIYMAAKAAYDRALQSANGGGINY